MSRRRRDPNDFIDTFSSIRKRVSAVAREAYATVEIGAMQAKLMRHVGRQGPVSQADLARATDSDPALTGRTLQTMIERGFVRRERSREDRREYMIQLTAAGRRICERIETLRTQVSERIVGALDERDLDDFDRIAAKILAALEA